MNKNELSTIFEKSISFEKIDKSKFNLDNKPIEEQLVIVNIFNKEPVFYYDKCECIFSINKETNNLDIQPIAIQNGIGLGTGLESRIKNMIKPNNSLIGGNCIYDLKVTGNCNSIKNVELKILSNIDYNLPFERINNEWVLNNFTKSQPLLLGCIPWCKFYLEVIKDDKDNDKNNIIYSYSIIVCKNEISNKIVCNKWTFDNITYDKGYITLV